MDGFQKDLLFKNVFQIRFCGKLFCLIQYLIIILTIQTLRVLSHPKKTLALYAQQYPVRYPIKKLVTWFKAWFGVFSGFWPYSFKIRSLNGRNVYGWLLVSFQTPFSTDTLCRGWHDVHMCLNQHWSVLEIGPGHFNLQCHSWKSSISKTVRTLVLLRFTQKLEYFVLQSDKTLEILIIIRIFSLEFR